MKGGVEERSSQAVGGEDVVERSWNSADNAVDAKAAQIVGHGTGAIRGEVTTEQGGHHWAEVDVTEAAGQVAEVAECAEQRLCARIAKAQGRHALAGG